MKIQNKILVILTITLSLSGFSQNRINHNGKDIFLSGMNLAWVNFSSDVSGLDAATFTKALDSISNAGGNAVRWWLHTNGTQSPRFKGDSVFGPATNELANLKKGLDIAYARGMGVVMCLWSFDMLKSSLSATSLDRNTKMLQDTNKLNAYIKNDLIPMLNAIGNHPAVICWEVFNEPEGMSNEFGWSDVNHVPMSSIQRFVNKVAGTVHRVVPTAKVSNGCWSFNAGTDVGGHTNYYRDDRLIAAGGDSLGTLDFYMVHYYDWGGTTISPFHHPKSYWGLDKPLVIGEFSAHGPYTGIDPQSAYNYLYENGYAGGLSWAWTYDGNGTVTDASEGMLDLFHNHPSDIVIHYPDSNYNNIPVPVKFLADTAYPISSISLNNFVDLKEYFWDVEDTTALTYTLTENTNTGVVTTYLSAAGKLSLSLNYQAGLSKISVRATDKGGRYVNESFMFSVYDTVPDNKALLRHAFASSTFRPMYPSSLAVDGDSLTGWIAKDAANQWIAVKLDREYNIDGVSMKWGSVYGRKYDIQTSLNGTDWTTHYSQIKGKGGRSYADLGNIDASYVRMIANTKNTIGGVSIMEFEVYRKGFFSGINSFKYNDETVKVYPVPAVDYLNIKSSDNTVIQKICLLNSSGQQVENITISATSKILDISKLSPGAYYMFVYTDNKVILKSFIKQ
jgi:hypothetical protein